MRCKPLVLLAIMFTGCAPLDTSYAPIEVGIDVRDATTHRPIEGARVVGSVHVFFYPESQDNMFGRPGVVPGFVEVNEPAGWKVLTNEDGTALTHVAGGNPTYLYIIADGYPSAEGYIETAEMTAEYPSAWTHGVIEQSLHDAPMETTRLEYRVRNLRSPGVPGTR
jgi:hypothetical protein